MFSRQSVQNKETENSLVVTYNYHEANKIMTDMVNISIYEGNDMSSHVATKDEIKKLIKILYEVTGEGK